LEINIKDFVSNFLVAGYC